MEDDPTAPTGQTGLTSPTSPSPSSSSSPRAAGNGAGPTSPVAGSAVVETPEQLIDVGLVHMRARRMEEALSTFNRAAAAASAVGDKLSEGRATTFMANVHAMQYNNKKALELNAVALAIFQALGDRDRESKVLYNMALAYSKLARYADVERTIRRQLEICSEEDAVAARELLRGLQQQQTTSRMEQQGAKFPEESATYKGSASTMMEFEFDNLPFDEVVVRANQGIDLLDMAIELFRDKATAEEKYIEKLRAMNSGPGMWSGLLGTSSPPTTAAFSHFSTVQQAILACRKASGDNATLREQSLLSLRNMESILTSIKLDHMARHKSLIAEARALIRVVANAGKDLSRANQRLEKARQAYQKILAKPAETNDAKRKKRQEEEAAAAREVTVSEDQVQAAAEMLVTARAQRDSGLAIVARQLQDCEFQRMATVRAALYKHADAEQAMLSRQHTLQAETMTTCLQSDPMCDMRLYTHDRRVAFMLREHQRHVGTVQEMRRERQRGPDDEEGAETPRSGRMGLFGMGRADVIRDDDDEGDSIVPNAHPTTERLAVSTSFIKMSAALEPVVQTWITALFERRGAEIYDDEAEAAAVDVAPMIDMGDDESSIAQAALSLDAEGQPVVRVSCVFSHPAGRALFLRSLNTQRTRFQNVGEGFERLGKLSIAFLDTCHKSRDVTSAKMMMIMSETFYKEESLSMDGEGGAMRKFIQTLLVGHPLWQDASFWEEAFYRSIREEVRKLTSTGSESTLHDPDSTDWKYMYQQMVFGQLGSYAMNMRAFGMAEPDVHKIVQRLGDGNGVSAELMAALFANQRSTA